MAVQERRHLADTIADVVIWTVAIVAVAVCLLPFVTLVAKSLSGRQAVERNLVTFWPIGFSLDNYDTLLNNAAFVNSLGISVARVLVGVSLNLFIVMVTAYALSQDQFHIPGRTVFKLVMIFGMLFYPGLIPTYVSYKSLGLLDTFAVLVLPGALNIFFTILMANFFRGIPKEMSESARLDGANHFQILVRVFLPLSLPSLATVSLFAAVRHWNSWFDGVIFLNRSEKWPLQTYLYAQVTMKLLLRRDLLGRLSGDDPERLIRGATGEALAAAMIVVATVPIMLVYPFVQRYFVKGLTLGALKG